jgi:hypothetical protein
MATANLNIARIEPADYVDPEVFNTAFTKLDALGVEYITETGEANGWWYRKWHSGRAECGIDCKNFGNVQHEIAKGSMYISEALSWGAYPFAFSSIPFCTINLIKTADGQHLSQVAFDATGSATTPPKFRIVDWFSGTAWSAQFGIYVHGTLASTTSATN